MDVNKKISIFFAKLALFFERETLAKNLLTESAIDSLYTTKNLNKNIFYINIIHRRFFNEVCEKVAIAERIYSISIKKTSKEIIIFIYRDQWLDNVSREPIKNKSYKELGAFYISESSILLSDRLEQAKAFIIKNIQHDMYSID